MQYRYRCLDCKEITEAVRSVEGRNDCPICPCGGQTRKIISLYTVHNDMAPYYDEHLQCHIRGKQHRQKVMKEQGVSEYYGAGWHTSARKSRH